MEPEGLEGLERELGTPGLAAALRPRVAAAPDPEATLRRADELLRAAAGHDRERLGAAWGRGPASSAAPLVRAVEAAAAVAPFLVRFLTGHPEWLLELAEDPDLAEPRTPEALAADLDAALEAAPADEAGAVLRRSKYRELARWCAREADPELVPLERVGEALEELTHLADTLLSRAFDVAWARTAAKLGDPTWRHSDGSPYALRMAVLGLGKLGGGELNFSSDVDLLYVSRDPGEPLAELTGGPGVDPHTFAGRVAGEFGRLVSEVTAEGFLYRVDLDLRPEGAQGPLVIGDEALAVYYDGWAAVWEKAALMKARPVAGDLELGWSLVRRIHPMIYRSSMDFAAVTGIKEMKARVERERGGGEGFDVKLGTGGIRDVEFIAQALQLLHGGRVPQLRDRSTQAALEHLAAVGVLPEEDAAVLLEAYRFLRRLENRLQMEAERQTHRLPGDPALREGAARAMGFAGDDAAAAFEEALEEHRAQVRRRFETLLPESGEERVLALFERSAPQLLHLPGTRSMVEELARELAEAVDRSADPELALNNLDRFIQGIGTRSFYHGLLLDRPELVPRLASVFATSKYLSGLLASYPQLIEPVFRDPDVLLLSREELEGDLAELRRRMETEDDRDPTERELAALRLFRHRQLVNVGLLDLGGKVERAEAERALTDIAEVCLEGALVLAREQLAARAVRRSAEAERPETAEPGGFLVVGMGKLGTRELTYGSDLDLIFLYTGPSGPAGEEDDAALAEAQSHYVRLAQKLIWALDTRTAEGFCYSVDARLRPSGQQGALVSSLAAFRIHHARHAMVWERQALLRARPVAGDRALADAFVALRRSILDRPPPEDLAREIHRVRMRMESELAQETRVRRDLKLGRGGLVDVESVVQYLQLRHGARYPALLEPERLEVQLRRMEELEILPAASAQALREGWDFLQRLSSRLRIVQNRSISDLREDRADLDSVARTLGYKTPARSGGARRFLLQDYRRHTETIRDLYLDVLGVAPPEP